MNSNASYHSLGRKTLMVWLAVALLGTFVFSIQALKDPVSMTVMPQVPHEGEPLMLSFNLYNPGLTEETYTYGLYINGEKVMQGESPVGAMSSQQHKYTYLNTLRLGEQTTFLLEVETSRGVVQKTLSIPIYAPQLWTSFVSIASYSMVLTDYNSAFAPAASGMNVGLIFTLILIPMLAFLILSEPYSGATSTLGKLNSRFSSLSVIMFIIFLGMVLTQMVMIIGRL